MYSCKYIREFVVIVLIIECSLCDMNEPRCRFDYEEKMLEKMVRTEIKNQELLSKLEVLEKSQTNIKTELDNTVKELQSLGKKHNTEIEGSLKGTKDLEKAFDSLKTELEKFENTTKSNFDGQEKSLEVYDQRLDAMFRNMTERMHHTPVAFFTILSTNLMTSSSNQTLVFDNVVTDVGGGYSPGTGVFTALVDGLYVFSTSVMVDLSTSTTAHFKINKNDSFVVRLYVNDRDGNYETVSGTVILLLQVGDTVKVTYDDNSRSILGELTFLSGFKLYSA